MLKKKYQFRTRTLCSNEAVGRIQSSLVLTTFPSLVASLSNPDLFKKFFNFVYEKLSLWNEENEEYLKDYFSFNLPLTRVFCIMLNIHLKKSYEFSDTLNVKNLLKNATKTLSHFSEVSSS